MLVRLKHRTRVADARHQCNQPSTRRRVHRSPRRRALQRRQWSCATCAATHTTRELLREHRRASCRTNKPSSPKRRRTPSHKRCRIDRGPCDIIDETHEQRYKVWYVHRGSHGRLCKTSKQWTYKPHLRTRAASLRAATRFVADLRRGVADTSKRSTWQRAATSTKRKRTARPAKYASRA